MVWSIWCVLVRRRRLNDSSVIYLKDYSFEFTKSGEQLKNPAQHMFYFSYLYARFICMHNGKSLMCNSSTVSSYFIHLLALCSAVGSLPN